MSVAFTLKQTRGRVFVLIFAGMDGGEYFLPKAWYVISHFKPSLG